MQPGKASRRYARALFLLAEERELLDPVQQDLQQLAALLQASPDLVRIITHPLLPTPRRQAALDALFQDKLQPLTRTFLALLDEKGRLKHLTDICEAYARLFRDRRGIEQAEITSATEMESGQLEQIRGRLETRFGKTVELLARVDASLIGGFRIRVRDTVIDYSLATRLRTFEQQLINA